MTMTKAQPMLPLKGGNPSVNKEWPDMRTPSAITYEQARAASEAGQKLHLGGRIYLVRRALRDPEEGIVLWVTDERTLGDHGVLFFPDGRVEAR